MRITVSGKAFIIPAAPASLWVAMAMSEDLLGAFLDLMDEADQEAIWDGLFDGTVDMAAFQNTIMETLTTVGGRPWWFTMRLLYAAENSWDAVGGYLALKNIQANQLSFQGFMDAVLAAVLRHVEPKNQASFLAKLRLPPAGTALVLDEAKEADAFMSYMKGS